MQLCYSLPRGEWHDNDSYQTSQHGNLSYSGSTLIHLWGKIKENFIQYFPRKKKCTLLSGKYGNTADLLYFGNKRVKLLCTIEIKIFCSVHRIWYYFSQALQIINIFTWFRIIKLHRSKSWPQFYSSAVKV
jgi:hypothetical protein